MSTLPPIQMRSPAAGSDELLDSLELQPTADELVPSLPELGLDGPAPLEEIETLDIDEDVGIPGPPPPPPGPSPAAGKTTLVSTPKETDDLRRKIARPVLEELNLEEMGEEEGEELDALSFEAPEAPAPEPATRRAAPAPEARPGPASWRIPTVDTAPVSVQLPSASGGQTDISIPVEVTVGDGQAQVAIHLRLTLSLKIKN